MEFGLEYPALVANYSSLFLALFQENGLKEKFHELPARLVKDITGRVKVSDAKAKLQGKLEKALQKTSQSKVLLSGEAISKLEAAEVVEMADFLDSQFEETKVIVYVRPPMAQLNSMIQQQVRRGASLDQLLDEPPPTDYQVRIQPFLDRYGAERVCIRPFHRSNLHQQCVVADLLQHCNIDPQCHAELDVVGSNASLPWPGVLFLDSLNCSVPPFIDGKPNNKRATQSISQAIMIGGEKFALPQDFLENAIEKDRDDIQWMEKLLDVDFKQMEQRFPENPCPSIKEFVQMKRLEAFPKLSERLHTFMKAWERNNKR